MRDVMSGVAGAGLVYALVWYQMIPAADVVAAAPRSAPGAVANTAAAGKARPPVAPVPEQRPSHVSSQGSSGEGALSQGPRRPSELERRERDGFIEPLPTALPKTIERMAELQRISADPNALATRVQAMETDEAELAELKAFAERFVELPPDRVRRHVAGTRHPDSANPSGRQR
jgi:hypothetical protein